MDYALAVIALLSQTPEIEKARQGCERDMGQCAILKQLQAEQTQRDDAQRTAAEAAAQAQRAKAVADAEADAQRAAADTAAATQALKRKCGKDFGRVAVGMAFARVRQCAGDFAQVAEDKTGAVWEADGMTVRVEAGKVVRWLAR